MAGDRKDTTLIADLELLVDPATKGNPMSPLRWTSKSTIHLAKALQQRGHKISPRTVAAMLIDQGYSLQGNRKSKESEIHLNRDQQFSHINEQTNAFQKDGQPVISVDTKKKELIGECEVSYCLRPHPSAPRATMPMIREIRVKMHQWLGLVREERSIQTGLTLRRAPLALTR